MQSNGLYNRTRIEKYDDKHIYYNAIIANPSSSYIPATFVDQRSQAILENQSDYHVSVIRFSIPGAGIPIFIFDTTANAYVVELEYDGLPYDTPLNFINLNNDGSYDVFSYQNFIDSINAAFQSSFSRIKTLNPSAPQTIAPMFILNEVTGLISLIVQNTYDPFISGVNTIRILFNQKLFSFFESFDVNIMDPGAGFGNYEFIVKNKGNNIQNVIPIASPEWNDKTIYNVVGSAVSYNGLNYLSIANVAENLDEQPDTSPLFWQVNYFIPSQYNALTSYSIGNTVSNLGIYYVSKTNTNLGNTPASSPTNWDPIILTGLSMSQESNTLYLWNELRTILFTTGTITVRNEAVPLLNAAGQVQQVNNNSLKILTDFEPQSASPTSGGSFKNYFQFYPQGPYRLLDLTGTRELSYIDFQIFWQNSLGVIFPLLIPPNQSVSVKIMFMKKSSTLNNEYLTYT